MFGSACFADDPRDIDVLIVYDPRKLPVGKAIDFRIRLAKAIFAATRRPVDILLLSQAEVVQTGFLHQVDPIRVFANALDRRGAGGGEGPSSQFTFQPSSRIMMARDPAGTRAS